MKRAAHKRRNGAKKKDYTPKQPRRVKSLLKFLKAYGSGEEGRRSRERFAKRVKTTLPYLVHLSYGYRTASPQMAAQIEQHTHGIVRAEEMRPDVDWAFLRHGVRKLEPINASVR